MVTFMSSSKPKNQHHSTNENISLTKIKKKKVENQTMQGVENLENRKEEGEKIPKQIVKTIKI